MLKFVTTALMSISSAEESYRHCNHQELSHIRLFERDKWYLRSDDSPDYALIDFQFHLVQLVRGWLVPGRRLGGLLLARVAAVRIRGSVNGRRGVRAHRRRLLLLLLLGLLGLEGGTGG